MAEQDRKDLIPSVLNDLIDVDGTPTEGDGLGYSDGAWRPALAGTTPYGPQFIQYTAEYTTGLDINGSETLAGRVADIERYVDGDPDSVLYPSAENVSGWGHWDNASGDFVFDEPGAYKVIWGFTVGLSGVPSVLCWAKTQISLGFVTVNDLINDYWPIQNISTGAPSNFLTEYKQVAITIPPEAIEQAPLACAFGPRMYVRRPSGSETWTSWSNTFTIEKWSGEHASTWGSL